MLHSPSQSLKSPREFEKKKTQVEQPPRRVLLSTCRIVALRSTQGWMGEGKQSWRGRECRKQERGRRMSANKCEYSFPRLLRLDQFSGGGGLKRGKHAGWWVHEPPEFSWMYRSLDSAGEAFVFEWTQLSRRTRRNGSGPDWLIRPKVSHWDVKYYIYDGQVNAQ